MLHALVKDKVTKEVTIISDNTYKSKEAFWRDLEAAGYIVKRISTDLDLKALEVGFETWSSLKKYDKQHQEQHGWLSQYHAYIHVEEARAGGTTYVPEKD